MKIPITRLQALYDGLRLLSLLSTQERPFDQVRDLAQRVRWYGMGRLPTALRQALAWVEAQARKQGYRLRRNDCDVVPEQPFRFWGVAVTPVDLIPLGRTGRRRVRRQADGGTGKPCEPTKPAPGLFDAFPWLKEEGPDDGQKAAQ